MADERHLNHKCPASEHVWRSHDQIFADFGSTMHVYVWHKDQKAIACCLLQLHSEYAGLSDALLT